MESEGSFSKPDSIRIRYRDLGDDDSNSYFLASTKLRPYVGEEIYVDPRKYSKVDSNDDVDDDLLNSFIERVLLSVTMKEAGEDDFGDSKLENESGISPSKRRATKNNKDRSLKQRRQDKKNKKDRKREDVPFEAVPDVNNVTQSTERNITLPLIEFRKMVNAEIESRAARIHVYYQKQWDYLQQDRMAAYRSCILWKGLKGTANSPILYPSILIASNESLPNFMYLWKKQIYNKYRDNMQSENNGNICNFSIITSIDQVFFYQSLLPNLSKHSSSPHQPPRHKESLQM
ncbi:Hypothetical predicted protein [Mytilus galloprovincialis]|uniref:Uncharacterized protein n=1 Tax=Mytilus galloprovincialis TaxID=29158 RepID=A0A8B6FA22_MYTGA|nr:Hypothetical predicted protein [Mytilus galloprovincialis]